MKKVWVIYIALLVFVDSFGQTTSLNDVKSELDAMFVGLDKTKVPTGFLWDTAVNLIEGEYYNGSALTDCTTWSMGLMNGIESSSGEILGVPETVYENYVEYVRKLNQWKHYES